MDAMVLQDERRRSRTAKPCGPGAPMLALSSRGPTNLAGDGGNKARLTGESAE